MADPAPINVEAVLARTWLERDDFVNMLDGSLPYLAQRRDALRQAIDAGDVEKTAVEAHAIKGSAASLGMEAVHAQALRLENIAHGNITGDAKVEFQALDQLMVCAADFASTLMSSTAVGGH